ncbi:ICMT-domain-containing protein [Choiromyces venosus 120613-1]|uniref:Protein-S-isoprenylcysteine O-methyltransferase n=1 Tax=Choiromyces venosus 120613-1 TaxID=1336337 RepID=A0A3N4JYW0_9PEZI|nr:ICMT-domain-containing protein [Choiromyces venosus 120613-1]
MSTVSTSDWHPFPPRRTSSTSSSRSPSPSPAPRQPLSPTTSRSTYRPKPFDIPIYFYPSGIYSLSAIAIRAFLLGSAFATSLLLAFHFRSKYPQLSLFITALSLFHFLEFWTTAAYNTRKAKVSSYLLINNGMAYNLAHSAAFMEGVVEWLIARSLAMVHAGTNFSHLVAYRKEEDHVLVKTGIYRYLRHPSYFGFFWWGLGTQIMLGNPVCFVGYMVVLWKFFSARVRGEEELLVDFFEDEYQEYRARTPTLIPFIR